MSAEFARLIEKHGGSPRCVPAVRECAELTPEKASALIDQLSAGRYDIVVFMTGVAVSLLFEAAEQLGRRPTLTKALQEMTIVCRGPKPSAALRGFGAPPTLSAHEPFTAAEVLDAMAGMDLEGQRVLLFHYGERSETLAETLMAWKVELTEFWLYRWLMPTDPSKLAGLVRDLLAGEVQALAITCQIQFRHLMNVAEDLRLSRPLVRALGERIVVGAVGPKCSAVLSAHGVEAQVVPEHPKMGPLAMALMRHLNQPSRPEPSSPVASAPPGPPLTPAH